MLNKAALNHKKQKILLVGDYMWPWYQEACARALENLGHDVVRFGWFDNFRRWIPNNTESIYHSFWHRLQYRLTTGPIVWKIIWRLFKTAKQQQPTVVWFYNVTLLAPWVVKKLKRLLPNAVFCQYSNDNPFSQKARFGLWRNYLGSIPCFDVHFAFRHSNIEEYYRKGAKRVELLRAYFIPEDEYPIEQSQVPEKFKCDVVFAGHYEGDGRLEILEAIAKAGYRLNLFGGAWEVALNKLEPNSPLKNKFPIMPATGADYRYAICGAKVALCFLSKLNQDTYTRRNFQIPAMKTAMLSEYTEDLVSLFTPGVESLFFQTKEEALEKLKLLIDNAPIRDSIAEAGFNRIYRDGHDVGKRMDAWLKAVCSLKYD